MDLRELLAAEAARRGVEVDLARACRALAATSAAFARRQAQPQPVAGAERRRLRRLVATLTSLEDILGGLERDAARPHRYTAWRARAERDRAEAEGLLASAERAVRPGPPRDAATRMLALEVAWILHREGLAVSAYPDGLLAQVARVVAERAGRRLGEDMRRLLRPAVAFCHRQGGAVPTENDGNMSLTSDPTPGAPYRQMH